MLKPAKGCSRLRSTWPASGGDAYPNLPAFQFPWRFLFGLLALVLVAALGFVLVLMGHDEAGIAFLALDAVGFGSAFIYGIRSRRSSSDAGETKEELPALEEGTERPADSDPQSS